MEKVLYNNSFDAGLGIFERFKVGWNVFGAGDSFTVSMFVELRM